jgi:hypothetical protein
MVADQVESIDFIEVALVCTPTLTEMKREEVSVEVGVRGAGGFVTAVVDDLEEVERAVHFCSPLQHEDEGLDVAPAVDVVIDEVANNCRLPNLQTLDQLDRLCPLSL